MEMFFEKGLKTFVDDVEEEEQNDEKNFIGQIDREEKSALAQLIVQSQNNLQEKSKSFDDLTSLNKQIQSFNEQVCFFFHSNEEIRSFVLFSYYRLRHIYFQESIVIVLIR